MHPRSFFGKNGKAWAVGLVHPWNSEWHQEPEGVSPDYSPENRLEEMQKCG